MFNQVNAHELQSLQDAISWITILIAGADGNIDTDELEWANKLTKIRAYSYAEELKDYYASVGENFDSTLKKMMPDLPSNTDERTELLTQKLSTLNPILAKMDNGVAFKLYESFLSFSEHVAKASGGFLRFATISKEEKSLMSLTMINPIDLELEEEEETDFEQPY